MTLDPDYGETLLSEEEAQALTIEAHEILGDPIRKLDLYDLEQQVQEAVADEWWETLLRKGSSVGELLTDYFVRDLHRRLYAPIWTWGGRQRLVETNIGIAPEHITAELRKALDDLSYQWNFGNHLTARSLGIAAHAAVVRIHPFVDGNGRVTRLLADLVFLAAQAGREPVLGYDWEVDRTTYIQLLREFDFTRDPTALTEFVPVVALDDLSIG